MKIFHHYHHSKSHSVIHSDFWNFELSVWLHVVGYSMISIFIPILMLTAGYSLTMVLVYCAVFFLIDTPLNFLASRLVVRWGARAVIILGTLSVIFYFLLFPHLSGGNVLILLALALLAALYDSFYWVAYYYLFTESSGKNREISKNNGILNGIREFGGMLGPAIGASILIFATDNVLFGFSIFFLTLSIIPLLRLRHTKNKPAPEQGSTAGFFRELPEKKNFLTWFLYSVHLAANEVIWPIFIFSIFGTLKSIALIAVIISVSKIILSYISGAADQKSREKMISLGILLIMMTWVLRLLLPNTIFYYVSILLIGFFTVLIEVPLDGSIFERARAKNKSLAASTLRNSIIMFPQGVVFAVLALLVGVFKVSFVSAIISLFVLLLINHLVVYASRKHLNI